MVVAAWEVFQNKAEKVSNDFSQKQPPFVILLAILLIKKYNVHNLISATNEAIESRCAQSCLCIKMQQKKCVGCMT